jgi:hypothetical protein
MRFLSGVRVVKSGALRGGRKEGGLRTHQGLAKFVKLRQRGDVITAGNDNPGQAGTRPSKEVIGNNAHQT